MGEEFVELLLAGNIEAEPFYKSPENNMVHTVDERDTDFRACFVEHDGFASKFSFKIGREEVVAFDAFLYPFREYAIDFGVEFVDVEQGKVLVLVLCQKRIRDRFLHEDTYDLLAVRERVLDWHDEVAVAGDNNNRFKTFFIGYGVGDAHGYQHIRRVLPRMWRVVEVDSVRLEFLNLLSVPLGCVDVELAEIVSPKKILVQDRNLLRRYIISVDEHVSVQKWHIITLFSAFRFAMPIIGNFFMPHTSRHNAKQS